MKNLMAEIVLVSRNCSYSFFFYVTERNRDK